MAMSPFEVDALPDGDGDRDGDETERGQDFGEGDVNAHGGGAGVGARGEVGTMRPLAELHRIVVAQVAPAEADRALVGIGQAVEQPQRSVDLPAPDGPTTALAPSTISSVRCSRTRRPARA